MIPRAERRAARRLEQPIKAPALQSLIGALGTLFGSNVQAGITSLLDSVHAGGIASVLPGGGQFTIYTITNGYPAAPADYRLRIDGLVKHLLFIDGRRPSVASGDTAHA